MFTDVKEALAAEDLELTPLGTGQHSAASLVVAHHARDKDDLAYLLDALGLPCAEDDLVRLLPHLTTPDHTPTGDEMSANAFTATAASRLQNGDSPEHVRSTLGLSQSELSAAVQHAACPSPARVPVPDAAGGTASTASVPDGTTNTDGIEVLLAWAENHPAASIRNRAARIRSELADLTGRRAADAAQHEAEQRVAQAKAELEAAQAELRKAKAGGRTPTTHATPPASSPAPASGSVPVAAAGRRSREELAAIRSWARANGHQVADRGTPARAVLDAYDAAHRGTALAEAV
ncbi:Lsr2 family DNA-binding protein [Streptomyces spectabilis]|uniref:Lsr2 DNA-binding domain-containing protein n=1 Tax=Streptomyces spectabilis TaxID=68270 RepID=A0A7W8EXK7_STRST|nr:hypothetical protein [Streptomyces spectabilis]MBB5109167.1 hypothetical protein [Streptomyces spectabilis]GGV51180.1 hypothetical protein GCM10010245_80580 [Streptomyces spectabilis]